MTPVRVPIRCYGNEYVTTDPAFFTVAAVLISLFSRHWSSLYDRLVERRQLGHVDCNAVFSYRFVALSSQVRDRLFQ
jgi:hypothetical protein